MSHIDPLTREQQLASLKSNTCPICNGYKPNRNSVCGFCWQKASHNQQFRLSQFPSKGYTTVLLQLLIATKRNYFFHPPEPRKRVSHDTDR